MADPLNRGPQVNVKYLHYRKFISPRDYHESEQLYVIRVNTLGRLYESLPELHQEFIRAAAEDGLYWRGEPIQEFRDLYDEAMSYRDMNEEEKFAYRQDLLKRCKGMVAARK